MGGYTAILRLGQQEVEEEIVFARGIIDLYLSRRCCRALRVVHSEFPTQLRPQTTIAAASSSTTSTSLKDPSDEVIERTRLQLLEEFEDVFSESSDLRKMEGEPVKITLKPDAKAYAQRVARTIPYAQRDQVKAMIDELVKNGIWSPVGDRPTEWCHPLVVVPKPGGKLRLCVDLTKLNSQVERVVYPSKTPRECVQSIPPGSRYFTKLDARHGYWQMDLSEESKDLTCFITPWGRFIHNRAPMGYVSSGDHYNIRTDTALESILSKQKLMDDICIYAPSFEANVAVTRATLLKCREHGITLSPAKMEFCKKRIGFVGYIIDEHGASPDPKKLEAITKFPVPTTRTDLRSFMGLVNQLGQFSKGIAEAAEPLRELLKIKNEYLLQPEHLVAFEATKKALVKPPVLAHFNPSANLVLETDASRTRGLGYALFQQDPNPEAAPQYQLVECGSRFLSPTETRYAVCELELLAIVWAIKKCHVFVAGRPFKVITDHKPLIPILNTKYVNDIDNARLQNFRLKLVGFQIHAEWKKGSTHFVPDALSRSPVQDPTNEDLFLEEEISCNAIRAFKVVNALSSFTDLPEEKPTDSFVEEIRVASVDDPNLSLALAALSTGEVEMPSLYKRFLAGLEHHDGVLLYLGRLVVPTSMRRGILEKLHQTHQGVEKTKARARQSVFWPGITNDIVQWIESCVPCQERKPSQQKEKMRSDNIPEWPFQCASSDLFSWAGKTYLVYACRLSGYPLVHQWTSDPTSRQVANVLRGFFSIYGIPLKLRTDGGPQYASKEFQDFLQERGVEWCVSSPHYPQSNGHAESMVKLVKRLVQKVSSDVKAPIFLDAMQELRNTPNNTGLSPNMWVMRRGIRSTLPVHPHTFQQHQPAEVFEEAKAKLSQDQNKTQQSYNQSAKDMPPLGPGDYVRIQDPVTMLWNRVGWISSVDLPLRRYTVTCEDGAVLQRNRRQLRVDKTQKRLAVLPPTTTNSKESKPEDKSKTPRCKDPSGAVPSERRRPGRPKGASSKKFPDATRASSRLRQSRNTAGGKK